MKKLLLSLLLVFLTNKLVCDNELLTVSTPSEEKAENILTQDNNNNLEEENEDDFIEEDEESNIEE